MFGRICPPVDPPRGGPVVPCGGLFFKLGQEVPHMSETPLFFQTPLVLAQTPRVNIFDSARPLLGWLSSTIYLHSAAAAAVQVAAGHAQLWGLHDKRGLETYSG